MKKTGLIGGISWVSTADYYSQLNRKVNEKLGGLEFPELLLYSFNYAEIRRNNDNDDWDRTFTMLSDSAQKLVRSGAEGIVLCANTMHLIADRLQSVLDVPLISITEATTGAVKRSGVTKAALLGTRFTMEQAFFRDKLEAAGITVLIPSEEDRAFIHTTIFDELGKGILKDETRERYKNIIASMGAGGATGAILGCTEIPLLIKPGDVAITTFDTTEIHTDAITRFILS